MRIPIHHDTVWEQLKAIMQVDCELSPYAVGKRNAGIVARTPCGNPRTYVRRVCDNKHRRRYSHRFHSSVEIDARKLRNCCGVWKVHSELFVYVHRITDIGKELPPL